MEKIKESFLKIASLLKRLRFAGTIQYISLFALVVLTSMISTRNYQILNMIVIAGVFAVGVVLLSIVVQVGALGVGELVEYLATRQRRLKIAIIGASITQPAFLENKNFSEILLTIKNNEKIDILNVYLRFDTITNISKYSWNQSEKILDDINRWRGHEGNSRMEWAIGDSDKTGYCFIPGEGTGIIRLFDINIGRNEISLLVAVMGNGRGYGPPSIGIGKYIFSFQFDGAMDKRSARKDLEVEVDYKGGNNVITKVVNFT